MNESNFDIFDLQDARQKSEEFRLMFQVPSTEKLDGQVSWICKVYFEVPLDLLECKRLICMSKHISVAI